jgi:hypothetical protein
VLEELIPYRYLHITKGEENYNFFTRSRGGVTDKLFFGSKLSPAHSKYKRLRPTTSGTRSVSPPPLMMVEEVNTVSKEKICNTINQVNT